MRRLDVLQTTRRVWLVLGFAAFFFRGSSRCRTLGRARSSARVDHMADQVPSPQPSWIISLIQGTTVIPVAFAKLINTVGDQIGLFIEPTHIRRKGQAEADVSVMQAKADQEIAVVELRGKLALRDIADRWEERVRKREARRQKNIESIIGRAVPELPDAVSDKPVDEDWVAQFFGNCEDISNEQMQTVWARILAGEVARPGSFSLRTLAVVRVMSKLDANTFTRFCSTVWQTPNELIPMILDEEKTRFLRGVELSFEDLIRLDSVSLIRFTGLGQIEFRFTGPGWVVHYYGRQHTLSKQGAQIIHVGKVMLTEVGKELFPIAGASPNEEHRTSVVSHFRQQGWEVTEA
jgi:uncharacterized repeat protein (TIGR03899 family)